MIRGIGTDIIAIERFADWHAKSHGSLKRFFSDQEIAYCCQDPVWSAARFAARFAAREALFKALSFALPDASIAFFALCAAVSIEKNKQGAPYFMIDWAHLNCHPMTVHLSLSHSHAAAVAFVILTD